jgi:hypothetical protein
MNHHLEPWTVEYWDYCECDYDPSHNDKTCSRKVPRSIPECNIQTDCGSYGPNHNNALRIVTCVNACQGIDNNMVENIVQLGLREYKRLTESTADGTPYESSDKYLKPRVG